MIPEVPALTVSLLVFLLSDVNESKLLKITFCLQTPETLHSILKAEITPLITPQINCNDKSIFAVVSAFGFFETIKFECNRISSQSSKKVPI